MRILIVSHFFHPFIGGLEEVALQQAKNLVEMGHEVKVVTSRVGDEEELEMIHGIEVHRVPASDFLYRNLDIPQPLFNIFELNRLLKRLVPESDVVHIHDRFYLSSFLATRVAKKFDKPIVLTIHVGLVSYENPLYRLLFQINEIFSSYVVKNASKIISVGDEIKEYISNKFKRPSLSISNAVEIDFYNSNINNETLLKSDDFKVLFVGRFTYKKGVDIILEVAERFDGDVEFICVGDGPKMSEIKEIMKKKNIENMKLTGMISERDKLRDYYISSDVLIFTSRRGEASSPLVILEALASGLPVLVMNTGGHARIIDNGVTGFVVEDLEDFIDKIRILRDNRNILKEMSMNARIEAERYTWSRNVEKLISVYKAAVDYQ